MPAMPVQPPTEPVDAATGDLVLRPRSGLGAAPARPVRVGPLVAGALVAALGLGLALRGTHSAGSTASEAGEPRAAAHAPREASPRAPALPSRAEHEAQKPRDPGQRRLRRSSHP